MKKWQLFSSILQRNFKKMCEQFSEENFPQSFIYSSQTFDNSLPNFKISSPSGIRSLGSAWKCRWGYCIRAVEKIVFIFVIWFIINWKENMFTLVFSLSLTNIAYKFNYGLIQLSILGCSLDLLSIICKSAIFFIH